MRPAPKSSPEAVSRRPDGRGARTVGRCPVRGPGNARAGWRGAGVRPGAGAAVSRRGWALFLAMSLIWGVPYLLIKVAVEDLPPVVVVFGRCVLGAALLLPWTVARGGLRPALRRWRPLLAFTALEMTGPWLLLAYAEQTLSSSLTGLLVAAVPFVAALAGWLAGEEERLTRVRLLGMGWAWPPAQWRSASPRWSTRRSLSPGWTRPRGRPRTRCWPCSSSGWCAPRWRWRC